jgi:penicillin-binding protein 2
MGSSIFNYLSLYGFGQKTGVEIGESSGIQHTPESLRANGGTWVAGDYLQLAIGQRGAYTPIQLAAYAMMIANNGVRYKTHFIHSVRSYDGSSETVIPAEIAAKVTWSQAAMDQVKKGMIAVGKTGTAKNAFADAPYTVACKTGTAQTGVAGASDHGTFIAYAPADNPEVAISVVLENGNSASASAVARAVLDAYFEGKKAGEAPAPEGVLIP